MNTKNLKSYAPKARRQFIDAVTKRAAYFGIYEDGILPVTFEGSVAIIDGKPFPKKIGKQRQLLEKKIAETGFAQFVSEIAYTWFNRLAAIRYMELHDYLDHGFRVLSHPTNADGLPEVLDNAADVAGNLNLDKAHIIELQLAGDKQEELYRELLLGQCHYLHSIMPFLFEALDDATELLLPDNLTKTDSILKGLISDIPEEDWQQIEVIGWLYQFYISEHKDAVIGKVVKSEDIPAATQLFTPNWIVKYLVQNSIGRQWLATYPDSPIKEKMEYYIEPAEQTDEVNAQLAAITPSSIDPESIKALDPACGSGHILVEIYELLREIYLERGYRLREIPELILTKNIYGLDIDDRAAQLAGFALLMKAREDDRRIFQRVQDGSVKLNVYALQSTDGWDSASLWQALNLDGKAKQGSSGDLFAENAGFQQPTGEYAEYFDLLKYLIVSFEQAKTLGSLIQINHQYLPTLEQLKAKLQDKLHETDPAAIAGAEQLLPVVEQSILLAQKYDAVIANPPYMGGKGMNATLKDFAKKNFPNSKSDLYAMFISVSMKLLKEYGSSTMVTIQNWMFISSFEEFRDEILGTSRIQGLLQIGFNSFPELNSKVVQCCAFTLSNALIGGYKGAYINLNDANQSANKDELFKKSKTVSTFNISQNEFHEIPGKPIAYWVQSHIKSLFKKNKAFSLLAELKKGLSTADNDRFLRYWHEVSMAKSCLNATSSEEAINSGKKWFPVTKGGDFRKWYGNKEYVINWEQNGTEIKAFERAVIRNSQYYFRNGLTWNDISSGNFGIRINDSFGVFEGKGPMAFCNEEYIFQILGFLNSSICDEILSFLCPSMNFNIGDVAKVPIPLAIDNSYKERIDVLVRRAIEIQKSDWNDHEASWNFCFNLTKGEQKRLETVFSIALEERNSKQKELLSIEREINAIYCQALSFPNLNIRDKKVSLYRIENLILSLLSYSIGCMFGRFALDQAGISYAHSENHRFKEFVSSGVYRKFSVDDDGIIPLAPEEWLFADDATARFREFVKTVWGTEHLQENLAFVAESLCLNAIKPQKGESAMETIRRYFSTQFFTDHCKLYKKRPIYWLFSSGKEKAFECLVYLHRYNEASLSRMRTEYVTPLMGKYESQYGLIAEQLSEASGTEQRKLEKELKSLEKKQAELRMFDEELKHYAEMRISLDLDDGVKVNYGKFGNLLANVKDIHGKAAK